LILSSRKREGKGYTDVIIISTGRARMAGHHPVGHGKSAPSTPAGWVDYWTNYYNKSAQLKRASQESWNATREIWKRKLVQAKRIRCQKCIEIVKLWLRTYGYGPERRVLKESLSQRGKTRRTTF
jgi:hypothetical protein